MIGLYFSGTGNSKYCVETFLQEYDSCAKAFSIEEKQVLERIAKQEDIVFGYPVQYSNIPKIVRDFVAGNKEIWSGKRVFVIATMALFSGDGAGVLARLLKRYGAVTIGGLHVRMPDSISDEKVLKHTPEKNQKLIEHAAEKVKQAAKEMREGTPSQEGIGIWYRLAGLFGQRIYFQNKTKKYSDKLKINGEKCIGCSKCVTLCPMENITLKSGIAVSGSRCTMCYRCVNYCPQQAITLLGKCVAEQTRIEIYL